MAQPPSTRSRLARSWAAAFLVAAAVVFTQLALLKPVMPDADAMDYLTHAVVLHDSGILPPSGVRPPLPDPVPPGRTFGPLYPGFLTAVMAVDGHFAETAACAVDAFYAKQAAPQACGIASNWSWGSVFIVQGLLAAAAMTVAFGAALLLTGSPATAWTALAVAAASGVYGRYAGQFLTEALVIPLGSALMLTLMTALRAPTARSWLVAGLLAGAAALVRPTFTYVLYALTALALLSALRPGWRRLGLLAAGALAAGYLVVTGPWMLRNLMTFGDTALTETYAGVILAQRVAYNAMTPTEWLASLVFWLPDFGDSLARDLFGAAVTERLDWFSPNSYYVLSLGEWKREYIAAAGGEDHLLGWLIREGVLGQPVKHALVTLTLILRGLWVSKYFGLIGALFLIPLLIGGLRRGDWPWLAFCLAPLILLVLHAGVSPSIPRYNLLLVPCMAVAAARVLVPFAARLPIPRRRAEAPPP